MCGQAYSTYMQLGKYPEGYGNHQIKILLQELLRRFWKPRGFPQIYEWITLVESNKDQYQLNQFCGIKNQYLSDLIWHHTHNTFFRLNHALALPIFVTIYKY